MTFVEKTIRYHQQKDICNATGELQNWTATNMEYDLIPIME